MSGGWTIEEAATGAGVWGRIGFDASGNAHVGYVVSSTSYRQATLGHAWRDSEGVWTSETVYTIADLGNYSFVTYAWAINGDNMVWAWVRSSQSYDTWPDYIHTDMTLNILTCTVGGSWSASSTVYTWVVGETTSWVDPPGVTWYMWQIWRSTGMDVGIDSTGKIHVFHTCYWTKMWTNYVLPVPPEWGSPNRAQYFNSDSWSPTEVKDDNRAIYIVGLNAMSNAKALRIDSSDGVHVQWKGVLGSDWVVCYASSGGGFSPELAYDPGTDESINIQCLTTDEDDNPSIILYEYAGGDVLRVLTKPWGTAITPAFDGDYSGIAVRDGVIRIVSSPSGGLVVATTVDGSNWSRQNIRPNNYVGTVDLALHPSTYEPWITFRDFDWGSSTWKTYVAHVGPVRTRWALM